MEAILTTICQHCGYKNSNDVVNIKDIFCENCGRYIGVNTNKIENNNSGDV